MLNKKSIIMKSNAHNNLQELLNIDSNFKNEKKLYGMTVKEYNEGARNHSLCFDQIKKIEIKTNKNTP